MNRTSKLILSASAAIVVLGSGVPVFAERPLSTPTEKSTTEFCTNLANKISDVSNSITRLQGGITTAQANRIKKLNTEWSSQDKKIADARAGWSKWRQQQFAALEAKATTDAQKTAVQTYVTTLTTAISTREAANDAARTTYRNGVLAALTAQNSQLNSQISIFTSAVNAAEAAAKSSCASSPSDTSIRTTFISSMKTARENFVSQRKSDGNISSQIKALAASRDATIHANEVTFKNAENAALKALLAVLPSTSSSGTDKVE